MEQKKMNKNPNVPPYLHLYHHNSSSHAIPHVTFFKIHYHLPNVTALFVREIIDPAVSWRANDASQSR